MDRQPKFSILILTRTPALIEACVESIIRNTHITNYEILIMCNCQVTPELQANLKPNIKCILHDNSGNFSKQNNMLAAQASGQYLCIMNDDVVIHEYAIERLIYAMEKDKSIGMTGGLLLFPDGRVQSCGTIYHNGEPGHIHRCQSREIVADYLSRDRIYQSITGALTVIRRADFQAVGGFDEQFSWAFEDCDLNMKVIHQLKKKIVYVAKSIAIHKESATRTNSIFPMIYQFKDKWKGEIITDAFKYQDPNHFLYITKKVKKEITFIVCVNDKKTFENALLASFSRLLQPAFIRVCEGAASASSGLNAEIAKATTDIIVCCHQDILFDPDFITCLMEKISYYPGFGVLGVAGRAGDATPYGGCILGNGEPYAGRKEGEVLTLDECLLVIRKSGGLRFDEGYGWHCYGADICMVAASHGLRNYAVDIPIKHMSQTGRITPGYWTAMARLKEKWGGKFPRAYLTHGHYTEKGIESYLCEKP